MLPLRMASIAAGRRRFPEPIDALAKSRQLNLLIASPLSASPLSASHEATPSEISITHQEEEVRRILSGLKLTLFLDGIGHLIIDVGPHDPHAMARIASQQLRQQGREDLLVGVVFGGDLLPALEELDGKGVLPEGLLTQAPPIAAHAMVDALPLRRAFAQRAQVILSSYCQPAAGYVAATQFFSRDQAWSDRAVAAVQTVGLRLDDPSQAFSLDESRDPTTLAERWPVLEVSKEGQVSLCRSASQKEPVDGSESFTANPSSAEERILPAQVLYEDGWQVIGEWRGDHPGAQALSGWLNQQAAGATQELNHWHSETPSDATLRVEFRLTQLGEEPAHRLGRMLGETHGIAAVEVRRAFQRRTFTVPSEALELAVVTRPAEEWLD